MNSRSLFTVDNLKVAISPTNLLYLIGLWVAYYAVVAAYNISPFHPLYRFPGPKLAAMSYLYEIYYDWWLLGRYTKEIQRMHGRYGPIVRISPDELHCNDPHFTDEIYASGCRIRDKWQHNLKTSGASSSSATEFATVSHELHRMRKGAIAKFFSRQQMLKLEGEVHDSTQRTIDKMLRCANEGPFDVKEAFNCFTADIISQYAFGEPMGFIDQDGWEPNFATWVKSFCESAYTVRYITPVRMLARFAPFFANFMGENMRAAMKQMTVTIPQYIDKALEHPETGRVFRDLLETPMLPKEEKTMYRLSGEGFNLLLAGTETTSATLTCITYYLLSQPETYARLMEALRGADPLNLKWTDLEQRPYLWGLIHEALRFTPGISHRSARIARSEDLVYQSKDGSYQCVVPRGTPIGMTSVINHWNEELFPDPDHFMPERWIVNGQPNYALEKFLISFGKGSRACLGTHLAYCELFLMTAAMAIRVLPRAKLYKTTIEDIRYDHDLVVPQTIHGSIAARIDIK
ncbi:cytochrome P450 [Hypoxylon sp. FL1284]|nr:cytochrome P450 [Hypoxylon sp. FL1284]